MALGLECEEPVMGYATAVMIGVHMHNGWIHFHLDCRVCLAMKSDATAEQLRAYCTGHGMEIVTLRVTPNTQFAEND